MNVYAWIHAVWTIYSHTYCPYANNKPSIIRNMHPMARQWGRGKGCRSWIQGLTYVPLPLLQHYEILNRDVTAHGCICIKTCCVNYIYSHLLPLYQWYVSRNYACQRTTLCSTNAQWSAVIARSFMSYKYSQQASHGSPMKERHGVSFMNSWSGLCITATIAEVIMTS